MDSKCQVEPVESSQVKKGSHVLLKQRPCRVVEVSHSKTGKHGHMKVHLVGLDVLTAKKYTWAGAGHLTLHQFAPVKCTAQLIWLDDATLSCLDEEGNELSLSCSNEQFEEIQLAFDDMEPQQCLMVNLITAPVERRVGEYTDVAAVDGFNVQEADK